MARQFESSERLPATKIPKKLFVLAFEGYKTELHYFNALKDMPFFEDKLIEIHCAEREKKEESLSSPTHVLQHLQKAASTLNADPKKDEIWMIVDQDRNQTKENKQNLNSIKKECTQKGFKLAVTVPLIEFWLYLHLVDVQKLSPEGQNDIYDNKKISTKRRYLERLLSEELQKRSDKKGYNKANIHPSRFLPTYRDAVERARAFDQGEDPYPRKLGSDLYKLFDALSEST